MLETLLPLVGLILASVAVMSNDAVQTLGTFIASNKKTPWWKLWGAASSVLIATVLYSWFVYDGDISFGRLDKIPPVPIEWYHALAPGVLLLLTRYGIPVSTTFLVLSAFASTVVFEKMLLKSMVGYAISAVVAYGFWMLLSKYLDEKKKVDSNHEKYWRVAQWLTTGWLWSTWLKHDLANIMIFLPRYSMVQSFQFQLFVVSVMLIGLAFMFYERGGRIQEIVLSKTNTRYVRSATLIDLVYCFVLYYFKEVNNIPMSTTFVFMGMLAGRELGIWLSIGYGKLTYTDRHKKAIFPMLYMDFLRLMLGLMISVSLAYGIQWYSSL